MVVEIHSDDGRAFHGVRTVHHKPYAWSARYGVRCTVYGVAKIDDGRGQSIVSRTIRYYDMLCTIDYGTMGLVQWQFC